MPRTKLEALVADLRNPQIPEPMYLKELFTRYAKAYAMTFTDIGKALGCSGANVSQILNRPTDKWTIEQLRSFCDVLHVPFSEAVAVAQLDPRCAVK